MDWGFVLAYVDGLQVLLASLGDRGRILTTWVGSVLELLSRFSPSAMAFISSSSLNPMEGMP
jgi:hypothetical protein